MNALTAAELKALNYLTDVQTPAVDLGTKLQEMIAALPKTGTPVNAVAASKVLTLTGVVKDGETVTINNPAVAGSDVYEFCADTAQTKTAPSNIAVNITANTTKSSGTLTVDTQPTSGDGMTIGDKEYIFVPNGTANAEGEISVGTNLATAQANIVAAINGTDDHNTANSKASAGAFNGSNVSAITALVGGTAGDAIGTTETFTAGTNVFGAATLGSGADCSAANAITALVAAVTASDTQGVGAADGAGDTVDFTADTAGTVGNAITVAETLPNGSFPAGTFAGGVNATAGVVNNVMVDASYLYVCISTNTWRRISLGSAF